MSFRFGGPTRFVFEKGGTRVLIERDTQLVFVIHYAYGCLATIVKFFCVNFCDDGQYKYKITNKRNIKSNLLADTPVPVTPVPVTTCREGLGGIDSIELPHKSRMGESGNKLPCNFVIVQDQTA
jgi:hypothetical protein